MDKKKKKGGHVAIPFLIAFLLGIVCIGGIAMMIFQSIRPTDNTVHEMEGSVWVPDETYNFTVLFVLDEKTDPCPLTFMAARFLPEEKKILLISMPSNMLTVVDGKQYTLTESYQKGGISMTEQAIANETGITIDRYAIFDSTAFQRLCNIFGGVMYVLPSGMEGFTESPDAQYFGPSKMEKIITYPLFSQKEVQRSAVASDVICDMINQADEERLLASMDMNFRTMVNLMDTDISSIDYDGMKKALQYLFKYGSDVAQFRIMTGTSADNKFVLSPNFRDQIAPYFAEEEAEE